LHQRIYGALNDQRALPIAFLDIVKAFDTVNINILLRKLHGYGIRGNTLLWLQQFLTTRSFHLVADNYTSSMKTTTQGVPQGTITAALLFLVFINDIRTCERHCTIFLYADDIAIEPYLRSHFLGDYLQQTLDAITAWAAKNQVQFSPKKSKYVYFNRGHKLLGLSRVLTLCDFEVEPVAFYRYLGMTLHTNAKQHQHYDELRKSVNTTTFMIHTCIQPHRAPHPRTIADLTRAYVIPVVAYSLHFCRLTLAQLHELQRLIVAPLRRALGLPRCACHATLLAEFHIPSPARLRESLLLGFARQIHKLPNTHYARKQFYRAYGREPKPNIQYARSLTNEITQMEAKLNLKHDTITDKPMAFAIRQTYDDWRTSKASSILQSLRSPAMTNTPAYIKLERNPVAPLRARLRFNLALLNYSINKRHINDWFGVVDAKCTRCTLGDDETPQHVLLHCPMYSTARDQARQQLQALSIDFNLDALLGEHRHLTKTNNSIQRQIIAITGEFILAIHDIRKF
jgi:hypothetical protein